MVQYGQGLMDAAFKGATAKKATGKHNIINVDSSDALRTINSSPKNALGQKQRYSYHPSKPAEQSEKIGQYITKEVRQNQA
mmetsp:Transcript_6513/g.8788  ORF Transcript_6513/g.8788 Transcript_6513/m.8788 type:complete len:81 (-) Transcript_6513:1794-2036(-)|eukprot:CAMPEP_0185571216 /NCGR_PEP_ID=MMETSP0434-20130131/3276_1 /TAXON_ID=626734 ORGANISM="Favella taraikaensis, Strain Fe Narragansett Bay" /NCGR_SAMPLE_ID=MMETSP0434 /ASSEMBLY_ACC=CAM_ASM_000379 /LENGTH=80 /DNA_ID=CAMNT_0028186539 /DNA_START=115 /DNA_END=357 /DNA_ORIENTATION=+